MKHKRIIRHYLRIPENYKELCYKISKNSVFNAGLGFLMEAVPSNQGGWITFYDAHETVISRYPTIRSKGVYFIQNMKFIPSPAQPDQTLRRCGQQDTPHLPATMAHISHTNVALPDDYVSSDNLDGLSSYIKVTTLTQPICITHDHQSFIRRLVSITITIIGYI